MDKSAIIVASGEGCRFGGGVPKQFIKINGKMVVEYTIDSFFDEVELIVLVVSGDYVPLMQQHFKDNDNIKICEGGDSRQISVYKGLEFLQDFSPKLVAIHDGVRMLVSKKMIRDSFETASTKSSAIPIVRITDSLWFNDEGNWTACNRDDYACSQTPQTFDYQKIFTAHQKNKDNLSNFSDCAGVYKKSFDKVYTYQGDKNNVKLTTQEDMEFISYKLS